MTQKPKKTHQKKSAAKRKIAEGSKKEPAKAAAAGLPLSAEVIRKNAETEREELLKSPEWKDAFVNTVAQEPLLVQGSTSSDEQYYLVEFRQDTRTTGLMIVDAVLGSVEEVAGTAPGVEGERLFVFHRREDIPTLLDSKIIVINPSRRIKISAKFLTVQQTLFWVPSDQSVDALMPFYVTDHVKESARDRIYVRVDGEIFPVITQGGKGL